MLAEERRHSILDLIQENGAARTSDLASRFGVSSQTIRRDLMVLEAHGHISKGYGGGVLADYQGASYRERAVQRQHEKSLIARAAVARVKRGMTVALGPGTTTEAIAHLLNGAEVHIVTNSVPVARAITHPATAVSLTGGHYRPDSDLLTGAWTAANLEHLFADIGFIGVSGIGQDAGYTVTERDEADVLRRLLRVSKHAVVVADSSKFQRVAKALVAPLAAAHRLITDAGVGADPLGWLEAAAVEVEVVSRDGSAAPPARRKSSSPRAKGGPEP